MSQDILSVRYSGCLDRFIYPYTLFILTTAKRIVQCVYFSPPIIFFSFFPPFSFTISSVKVGINSFSLIPPLPPLFFHSLIFLFFIFIIFISSLYYSNLYKISFVFKVYVQHERNPTHMYKYIFPLSIIRSRLHSHIFYHTTHDYLPTRIFSFFFSLPPPSSLFSSLFLIFFSNIFTHGGSRIVRFNVKRALDRTERR